MDQGTTPQEADTINEQMVRDMEQRRQARPERRQPRVEPGARAKERRHICAFCYQPGDHPSPLHCIRALERQGQ